MINKTDINGVNKGRMDISKITFYTIVWNFLLGSFFGFCLETIVYFYLLGHFINRQGVIYGPFSQIYGFGVIVFLVCLYKIRDRKWYIVFLASMAIGTIFEYVASIYLEKIAGYASWDYSSHAFNFEGRVCLLISAAWGIFGMLYIKNAYPFFCKVLSRINKKLIKTLLWLFFLFMIFDLTLSEFAINRMEERESGIPAENKIEKYLDEHYPDEKLKEIFTSVKFIK
ncbi:putative ABC transporter permease [Parasporobacterium paucivorans]|uniref:Putative ABC-transporter type IV n=1 Tax=Parasporobacterium paucivorans DSM 15970 TaxID=1122934 RepID=A0A1M6CY72_9FIRM|nr:putative ABC transporter permease [Parasporobacterium paucivorans]SHI65754.1 Putative ABC-transporter type IV [Parasporobacterium paucivorans DSM 15970]